MIRNKQKVFLFGSLVFTGIFLYFQNCLGSKFVFSSTTNLIYLFLISFVDTFIYIFVAPLPWLILRKKLFIYQFFGAFLFCFFPIIFIALVNLIVGNKIGLGSLHYFIALRANLYLHMPIMLTFGYITSSWQHAENKAGIAQEQLQMAQDRLLKNQLCPHVLGNIIAGIKGLAETNPKKAVDCLNSLSNVLYKILSATEKDSSTLADERQVVEDYVCLESLRLGIRLNTEWVWDDALNEMIVPNMLMQPLAENAIKHGISNCPSGGTIRIIAEQLGEGKIRVAVENTGLPLKLQNEHQGIGVKNLQSRLKRYFKDKMEVELTLKTRDEWTVAEIVLAS